MFQILKILTCVIGSLQTCASAFTRFEEVTPAAQRACVCPGDVLTYECVIAGSGTTVWTGSGFMDCPSQGNQILLLHSLLMEGTILERECDGGSIIAEGTEITDTVCGNDRCYRSRLNVTVNHNTTVMCIYDDASTQKEIGNSTIHISGPPEHAVINLVDANPTYLTFSILSPVLPNCSRLTYNIEASNCGSCPNNTDSTTIICSNFDTSVETNTICNLTVRGVICENMPGKKTSLLTNLRVPNAPVVESQPVYLQERPEILAELITSFNVTDTFNISNTLDVSAINYTIIYSDSISGKNCSSSIIIPASSCVNVICSHVFDVLSSSDCPASTNITTTVFASNILGSGPPSNSITSGTNNFVRVNYDFETNRFNCTFFNLLSDDLKHCTANITYGTNCDQQLPRLYINASTGDYVTTPPLESISDVTEYCFTVVASSGSFTAVIRGRIFVSMRGTLATAVDSIKTVTLVIATIIPCVAVIALVLTIVFIVILLLRHWHIQKLDYTIKISIQNDIDSHIKIFQVFEELGTNINGFNTHLHHENLQKLRKSNDLPKHSIYHMHCECSTEAAEGLKATLCEKLIPEKEDKREQLIKEVEVVDSNNGEN